MSNMSYCRFQNTYDDLVDCMDALDEIEGDVEALKDNEKWAAKKLIDVCRLISDAYGADK